MASEMVSPIASKAAAARSLVAVSIRERTMLSTVMVAFIADVAPM
jgi:hypothetical protein